GHWLAPAAAYSKRQAAAPAARPTWLSSSGPAGRGDPVTLMQGWPLPAELRPLADVIQPRGAGFFHGASCPQTVNFAGCLVLKALKAPTGDFRDWAHIEGWARATAAALQAV